MDHGNGAGPGAYECELREQDRWLPIANVARLMKGTLPPSAKVSKDAKECMQECVSEFISFITSEASERCFREKRKTINGEDILYSMHDLGFENYAEVLKIYLAKYREQQALKQERGETRTSRRQRSLAVAAANAAKSVGIDNGLHDGSGTATTLGSAIDSQVEESPLEGHSESSNEHLSAPPPEEYAKDVSIGDLEGSLSHKDGLDLSPHGNNKKHEHELMEEPHFVDVDGQQRQEQNSQIQDDNVAPGMVDEDGNLGGSSYYETNQYQHESRSSAEMVRIKEEDGVEIGLDVNEAKDSDVENNLGYANENDSEAVQGGSIPNGANDDSYEYTDFMGEPTLEGHHNMDEFTKLANDEADIDVLSADITNGNGEW